MEQHNFSGLSWSQETESHFPKSLFIQATHRKLHSIEDSNLQHESELHAIG